MFALRSARARTRGLLVIDLIAFDQNRRVLVLLSYQPAPDLGTGIYS